MTESSTHLFGLRSAKTPRPLWVRILIWIGVAFLLLNTVGLALFFLAGTIGRFLGGLLNALGPGFIAAVVAVAVLWPLGGSNLIRTAANGRTADFKRRDDPAAGGHVYDVRPARASWLPVLVLTPLCAALGLLWSGLVAVVLGFAVGSIFLLPGARHRKRVQIAVSPEGLRSGAFSLPIGAVDEISVGNNGVGISSEPLMPGPNGVSTSSLVGRGMARRQVERSYTVAVRGDGVSHATVIAGGLTEECAHNLAREIAKSVERFGDA